jgi:hypothetical protein
MYLIVIAALLMLLGHLHDFYGLVPRNGRELVQELIEAHPDTHVIEKSFDPNTGSAEYRCSILNFGVYADRVKVIHKTGAVELL